MTFFYDLNKKLDSIREKPEVTHGQLNERDMSRAAKGYEKYGKQGMEALAKAGREGKALDPVRKKYDKYDEGIEDRIGDLDMTNPVNQPTYQRKAAAQGGSQKNSPKFSGGKKPADMPKSHEGFPRFSGGGGYTGKGVPADESVIYDIGAGIGGAVKSGAKKALAALNPNKPKKPTYPPLPRGYEGSGQEKADWDKFTGRGDYEESAAMTPKQKKFAALADPKDKITFADKIAGAKKEVDEMLGDVAAEAMKNALSGGQKKLDKNNNGRLDANDFEMLRKGGGKAPEAKVSRHSLLKKVTDPKTGRVLGHSPNDGNEMDEGWDDMLKDVERRRSARKVGDVTHGAKHDTEEIPGGRRVTRRTDPNTGYSVGTDDDTPAGGEKRGRGRPKGSKAAIGAKGPSGKSKLMNKEASHDENPNIAKAKAILKKAGYTVSKSGEEEIEEKAVSKKQQRFMGMVHATQKGEKAPSKEVAKVAKSMGKKDAEDFASTKHKGLPEKKKPEAKKDSGSESPKKKKEKTEEAGGTGTPTASSGFSYGKGIYDSMNRELESMIAEGMNVSMNMNSDANGGPSKSLTVTATDEDALKLSELLKNAGLGGNDQGYGGSGYKSACGCGTPDCSCGEQEMDEAYGDNTVSQNKPNWPTNTETSDDALQYSGGLNKPKSTGQSTTPVLASQEERQESYAEAEEDAIKRMMEMAGVPQDKMALDEVSVRQNSYATVGPEGYNALMQMSDTSGFEIEPDEETQMATVTVLPGVHPEASAAIQQLIQQKLLKPIADFTHREVGTVPNRPGVYEQDEIARMMEMAGVKKKTDEEKTEEGNLFTGNLAKARADGKKEADLDGDGKMEKVDEGILSATANLWSEYKGRYGV